MNLYKADLHIHTVLSPCGDLEMSPDNIIAIAKEKGLNIIGITDHNTTLHVALSKQLAQKEGIMVLGGAEVTTKEEAHCLAFFETEIQLAEFQKYLSAHLPDIPNDADKFGEQLQVNENLEIVYEEPRHLLSAIDQSVEEIDYQVHQLNGIFIPAHINKLKYSLVSQLGFIPFDLQYEAVEISAKAHKEEILKVHKYLKNKTFIQNSDAHIPDLIGSTFTYFEMEALTFDEIKKALARQDERRTYLISEMLEKQDAEN